MKGSPPKLCVVAATPLTVHFFLKPHLVELSQYFTVTLACNPKNDAYLPPLDLPVRQVAVGIARKISPLRDLLTLFELYRLFRREHFDVVASVVPKAGMLGMVAAALARVKHRVHIFQGEVWASKRGFMRALLKTMDRLTVKMATDILAVSASERRFLEEQGVARPGRILVLGSGSISGVDMARFQPDPDMRGNFRKEHGIPDEAVVCLFLGRLTADKGIFDLLAAFALAGVECPNLWMVFAGPDEEDISHQFCSALKGGVAKRLVIKGFTHMPERCIAAADFLCLPSYREGFGMVIIEAAACGITSIGSRIYGIIDAIKEGETGLLVNPGDVPQLSKAISSLVKNTKLRADLALAARIRVEREFKQQTVVGCYVSFFRKLFDDGRITTQ